MSGDSEQEPESEGVYILDRTALAGFILSGAVGALALFSLPLFLDTSNAISLGTFREPFILITLVEFAAALGVLYFGMKLYNPGPDVETAPDGGREP
jgi:hypothetical protein